MIDKARLRMLEVLMSHFVHYNPAARQYAAMPGAKPLDESEVHALDVNQARTCRECLEPFEGPASICPECEEIQINRNALRDLQERESSDGLHPGHDF